jgi:hypothetical protein
MNLSLNSDVNGSSKPSFDHHRGVRPSFLDVVRSLRSGHHRRWSLVGLGKYLTGSLQTIVKLIFEFKLQNLIEIL